MQVKPFKHSVYHINQKINRILDIFKQNQQDATLHNGIYYYKSSTCFRWFATHNQELKTVYTTSGICQAFTAS